jgi:hypothetical protein
MPFDEQQYDWQEVPTEGEKAKKSFPSWIKWVGIGFVAIILLIAAFFLIRGMVNHFAQNEKMEEVAQEMTKAENECLDAQDQEKCISRVAFRLASDHGDADYCAEITDDSERDDCFAVASLVSLDREGCHEIVNDALRAECGDAILAQTIQVSDGIEACAGFSVEKGRVNCENSWVFASVLSGECPNEQITQEVCDYGTIITSAIVNENPDLCDDIQDEDFFNTCIEVVTTVDRDQDGLTEDEEEFHGTDDRNPDTDGDGYTDKDEIDGGYNPLG